MAFSPDGRYVATMHARALRVFETDTGKQLWMVPEQVDDVTFSHDGHYIAAAFNDSNPTVFETNTGKKLAQLTEEDPVNAVAFSPDGRYVLTFEILENAGQSPAVIVTQQSLQVADLIKEVCSRLTRDLTQAEWKQYLGDEPRQTTCSTFGSYNQLDNPGRVPATRARSRQWRSVPPPAPSPPPRTIPRAQATPPRASA